MNYFERLRQDWIHEMLDIYGYINRHHLMIKFDISMPQASKDLVKYHERFPTMVQYSLKDKCYIRVNP